MARTPLERIGLAYARLLAAYPQASLTLAERLPDLRHSAECACELCALIELTAAYLRAPSALRRR